MSQGTEPISDPRYWRRRLRDAPAEARHHAIFRCPLDRWLRVEAKHREILRRLIGPEDSVLDAGCGYGRLLTLMPAEWRGVYRGIDISPEFIDLARTEHPGREFVVADLASCSPLAGTDWDWAILISIRPMVRRNTAAWDQIEAELRKAARQLLYLEYDENDEGSVE